VSTVPLKYIAKINAGQSPPSTEVSNLSDNLPFLQGNAEFQQEHPAPRFQCNTAPKIAQSGDILLSVRAPVGALNVADRSYGIGRGLCAITPANCDGRFLWWWFHAQRATLDAVSTGTTYRAVTAEDVGALPFSQLDIVEQRRIADFLDAETVRIDRLLTLKNSVQMQLIERVRSVRDGLVDRLADLEASVPLRRFITRIEQGASPQCEASPRAGEDEWAVLKLSSVKNGKFHPGENKRLPDDGQFSSMNEVRAGDLLVTRANTPSLVGDVAVVGENPQSRLLLPDLIYRVGLIGEIKAEYVAQIALSGRIRSLIESVARGTSQSMVKLRGEDIKEWPIPITTLSRQAEVIKEIAAAADTATSLQRITERQVKLLTERRQALITVAVTGQIDVSTASGRGIEE
jgi:type I restriction enzyme S subunit